MLTVRQLHYSIAISFLELLLATYTTGKRLFEQIEACRSEKYLFKK